jgi:RNA polymerase sigma factor (sigma-70 family)
VALRETFELFVADVEPRLRTALVSTYGVSVGREAALDALAWAWSHWDRVVTLDNPVGYLYRVGQTAARHQLRQTARTLSPSPDGHASRVDSAQHDAEVAHIVEPALEVLSEQQRVAVVLVHGHGMTLRETAEVMDVSVATVREHTKRALARLRTAMEVTDAV